MAAANKQIKPFFINHSKSSAAIVSIVIHLILLVVAGTFVAVTVVTKNDQHFESKQVTHPRIPLKKLQVPVKIRKPPRTPKLRQRIVMKHTANRNMPEIKMPEISGIRGGLGTAGSGGLGYASGIGFSMPEINLFGIKKRGEKVFIVLDSRNYIMYDEIGGIAGYTLIKDELTRILESLSPTTLFNIAVFNENTTFILFPKLVPANEANLGKIGTWLEPLNQVKSDMKADQFGPKTLGAGGHKVSKDFRTGKIQLNREWYPACAEAMKQQADIVFLLAATYGNLRDRGKLIPMSSSARKIWEENYQKALKLLDEDNKQRQAKGEPPRAINRKSETAMNKAYFPGIEFPKREEGYWYTPRDFRDALLMIRKKHAPALNQVSAGLTKKNGFSINVIQFVPQKGDDESTRRYDWSTPKLQALTKQFNGEYHQIKGMAGIKSSIQEH